MNPNIIHTDDSDIWIDQIHKTHTIVKKIDNYKLKR